MNRRTASPLGSLRTYVRRYQQALRQGDSAALGTLLRTGASAGLLSLGAALREATVAISQGDPRRDGRLVATDVFVAVNVHWSAGARLILPNSALSTDGEKSWCFLDGVQAVADAMRAHRCSELARRFSAIGVVLPSGKSFNWAELPFAIEMLREGLGCDARKVKAALQQLRALAPYYQAPLPKRVSKAVAETPLHSFVMRPEHLDQLRAHQVSWDPSENGAPTLLRPLRAQPASMEERRSLVAALQILLQQAEPPTGLDDRALALLRAFNVVWNGGGRPGPGIDSKRPYGLLSYFEYEMAETLGIEPQGKADEEGPTLTQKQLKELRQLHRKTEAALRLMIEGGQLTCQRYRSKRGRWEPARRDCRASDRKWRC